MCNYRKDNVAKFGSIDGDSDLGFHWQIVDRIDQWSVNVIRGCEKGNQYAAVGSDQYETGQAPSGGQ